MRHLKLFGLFATVMMIGLSSCGKEVALCSSSDFDDKYEAAINEFSIAQSAYFNDPENTEKCETFRTAYLNYINQLRDLTDCAAIQGRADFSQSLDEAEADFENFEC